MLIGNLNIQNRVEKAEILKEIKKSERLACLKTFNNLFKRDRSDDQDMDYIVNMSDVRNGMSSLSPNDIKDYNLDILITIMESEQRSNGMKDTEFADWITEYIVIEPRNEINLSNGDTDGLKYVFDELKTPGKETIDIKRLTELNNDLVKGDSEPKYTEEQLKKMIDVTSIRGNEITYEDFRKLFLAEIF